MNQHRQESKTQLRTTLEVLASIGSTEIVEPMILEYEKKFGSDGWLRHYAKRYEEKEREHAYVGACQVQ
jgi:hypothetical protein